MISRRNFIHLTAGVSVGGVLCAGALAGPMPPVTLLNVSYDTTRELYADYNAAFSKHWMLKTGQDVTIKQSHSGSGKQAKSVVEGAPADVVTLALAVDVDTLAKNSLIPSDWQTHLGRNSAPYTSTVVFLVRKGNPKGIKDWDDLVKPGMAVITANPKTSGGARWNYLAAWEFAKRKSGGSEAKTKEFVGNLYKNVPILDMGARGSTLTFAQRNMGDVLVTWESEAFQALKEFGADKFQIVVPSVSILAEPTVTLVDKNVDAKGTRAVATAYLEYLYSDEGQDIIGRNYYRPTGDKAKAKYASQFPKLTLATVDQSFGGWTQANKDHFADGASFDQVYTFPFFRALSQPGAVGK